MALLQEASRPPSRLKGKQREIDEIPFDEGSAARPYFVMILQVFKYQDILHDNTLF